MDSEVGLALYDLGRTHVAVHHVRLVDRKGGQWREAAEARESEHAKRIINLSIHYY